MSGIFLKLLNMSITAGWLIIVVVLLRIIFKRAPRWIYCLLWAMVAFRLICPFSFESQFSVLRAVEPVRNSVVVDSQIHRKYVPSIDSELDVVKNRINPMLEDRFSYEEYESAAPFQVFEFSIGVIWIIGASTMILYGIFSMLRIYRRVDESICVDENIFICDDISTPFILGIFSPKIYIPSNLSRDDYRYIICHENTHLKRGDHIWKLISYILLSIYWFNPLCWLSYILFSRDVEFACDERVIRDISFEEKKEYSRVLLSCADTKKLVFAYPLAFGEVGVKERVKSVLNYKKPKFWIICIGLAICVAISICFLTNPSSKEDNDLSIENRLLAAELDKEKVNILVEPSMLSKQQTYYYIPKKQDQKWIKSFIEGLVDKVEPSKQQWRGHKEIGWRIYLNDIEYQVFDDGYIYYTYIDDNNKIMEYFVEAPKLCDYINNLLIEDLEYTRFEVSDIKDIVSAKLEIYDLKNNSYSNKCSQTINDSAILKQFEDWFSNAEYIWGGVGCANNQACLELTLKNGKKVKLSMASDSCTNFGINGIYYNYNTGGDNRAFYNYFDKLAPYMR